MGILSSFFKLYQKFACKSIDAEVYFDLSSGRKKEVLKLIQSHIFEDYSFTEAGISVNCDAKHFSYMNMASFGSLWPEEGENQEFYLSFEIQRTGDYERRYMTKEIVQGV